MIQGNWLLVCIGLGAAVIIALYWLTYRLGHSDGWEAHRQHEINRHNERVIRTRWTEQPARPVTAPAAWQPYQPGRHAPWQQRLTVTRAMTFAYAGTGPTALTAPITHGPGTDSGAMRALVAGTDLYVDRMRAREAAWRRETEYAS